MKILVVGGAGFIGGNLSHYLYNTGASFTAVDDLSFGYMQNVPTGCDFVKKDFKDLSQDFLDQYDILVHVACSNIIYAMKEPIATIINNGISTVDLFSKFKGKIIYTSTASVYGQADNFPTVENSEKKFYNAYDTSKYIAEQYLRARGNYTTLRLSNVYGRFQRPENPYCGVIGKFMQQAHDKQPMTIYGDGNATRDYTYVEDVVEALSIAINIRNLDTEINIATSVETSVMELAYICANTYNYHGDVNKVGKREIDCITRRSLSNRRAYALMEWTPKTCIEKGIEATMHYFVGQHKEQMINGN